MLRLCSAILLRSLILYWLGCVTAAHAGGAISGKVLYSGQSENKEFLFSKFPNAEFCSKHSCKDLVEGDKRIPTITIFKHGGLAAAVVAVTDIEVRILPKAMQGPTSKQSFANFMTHCQ